MVDQEISQHRAAQGSDERCHHRVSQGRAPLSQNRMLDTTGHTGYGGRQACRVRASGRESGWRPHERGRKRRAWPNQVWSYDFVFDRCANGQQLKCLTVTDEFTNEGLAIDVDGRIRSARVIEVLSRLVSERGAPAFIFRTVEMIFFCFRSLTVPVGPNCVVSSDAGCQLFLSRIATREKCRQAGRRLNLVLSENDLAHAVSP